MRWQTLIFLIIQTLHRLVVLKVATAHFTNTAGQLSAFIHFIWVAGIPHAAVDVCFWAKVFTAFIIWVSIGDNLIAYIFIILKILILHEFLFLFFH